MYGEVRRAGGALLGRERIVYWEKWSGLEWDAMARLVSEFNEGQNRYEVAMVAAGDWASSPDTVRFESARLSGEAPDLIGLESRHVVDYANGGLIAPITLDEFGLCPHFAELARYQGENYGLIVSGNIVTLHVNRAFLDQSPRLREGVPADLRDFDSSLRHLARQGLRGFVPVFPGWWPHIWPHFFKGRWVDENGRFTPGNPCNIAAYEWVMTLRDLGDSEFTRSVVNPIGPAGIDAFLTSRVGMVLDGDWLFTRMAQVPAIDWIPAPFPSVDGIGRVMLEADVLAVPTKASNREGALDFLRFMADPGRIEQLAIGQMKIAPLIRWSAHFAARHPNRNIGRLREIMDTARLIHDPRVPGWPGYAKRIERAFTDMWVDGTAPAEALAVVSE